VPTENQVGWRASGFWKIAGAIPVGAFLILRAILIGHDSGIPHESPLLLASLNTIFLGGFPLVVVLMATRSYQTTGSLTFLMMGCGALVLGVSSLLAGWVLPASGNENPAVTLHNMGCLFAGFCHLASAHYLLADLKGAHLPRPRSRQVAKPYAGIVVFVGVAALLAVRGLLPVFIAPGAGPGMIRQIVLGGALWLFALSGLIFVGIYFWMKTGFAYWYGLALWLFSLGLVCVLIQKSVGGTIGWAGRSAQYLGSLYFIFALLAGRREMGQASGSAAATTRWGLWPFLEQRVKERTLALEKANEDLQKEIAGRKLTEQALQESEERYRRLFEAESDAIFLGDQATQRVIDANAAATKLYGYSREEFLLLKASDISAEPGKTSQAIAEDQRFVPLRWHRKKDGAVFPVEISLSFFWYHGRDVHEAIIRDITERRRAEEDVRRSETKFRMLYNSTGDAIMLLGEKGFFDCNPAALAIFGCATREEFCSKHPGDLSPPLQPDGTDSRTLANRQIARAMETGNNYFEWMHKRADTGEVFPADVMLSAMELDGKRVLQATVRDLTERMRAEEAVSKALAMQRAILDSTTDFIWAVDSRDFGLMMFNRAFDNHSTRQHGLHLQVGKRPEELLPTADYIERWRGYFQRALASGPFTTEYLTSSGKVTLLLTFNLLKLDEAVFGVSVFGKDITEIKRKEEALRVSHEQLRALAARVQAVREEERTRIAREIHDVLAQDLTSLKIDVTLLSHLLAQPPGELAQSLIREKLVAMTIATDTAIQSVQTIATDLRPVVLDSLGLCAAIEWEAKDFQAHTGIGCAVCLPAKDLPLDRDRSTALFRILQESLTNVVRHAAATRVEVDLHCEAGHITLTVRDNGRGIPESQAHAPGALGLLGMRERALLLGGRCDIIGLPGEGTRVEVRLPLPPTGHAEEKQL
jgi:PAS domain S-box-containing protein